MPVQRGEHGQHGVSVSPCRRFRCRTLEDLVRWSNALSLSLCPPPVTEAQLGLAKDSYRGFTGTEALRAPKSR